MLKHVISVAHLVRSQTKLKLYVLSECGKRPIQAKVPTLIQLGSYSIIPLYLISTSLTLHAVNPQNISIFNLNYCINYQ